MQNIGELEDGRQIRVTVVKEEPDYRHLEVDVQKKKGSDGFITLTDFMQAEKNGRGWNINPHWKGNIKRHVKPHQIKQVLTCVNDYLN